MIQVPSGRVKMFEEGIISGTEAVFCYDGADKDAFLFRCAKLCMAAVCVFLVGCTHLPMAYAKPEVGKKLKKVAVLPFSNISGRRDAGKIVSNIFVTELFKSGKFHVEEPGNVAHFMMQERMDTIGEIEMEGLKILGKRLGVDTVMLGVVEEFDDGGASSVPVVSITARMIDSNSGQLVWSGQNRRRGDDYIIILDLGEVRSVSALTQKVIGELIQTIPW